VLKSAIYNGHYQLDYRRAHGFQEGILKPFRKIASVGDLAACLAREFLLLVPHIFVANRRPMIGFRPLNAMFRFLMVYSYSLRSFRENLGR